VNLPLPPILNPQEGAQQLPFQFQATEDRTRRKGQKRVGKKAEPQPLVGMFNDALGRYDSPEFIREAQ